jgi:hypothetical protein
VTGGVGITVAHELGHKAEKIEQLLAKVLLMTVCYMHFYIEHIGDIMFMWLHLMTRQLLDLEKTSIHFGLDPQYVDT